MANIINFGPTIKEIGENKILLNFPNGSQSSIEASIVNSWQFSYGGSLKLDRVSVTDFGSICMKYVVKHIRTGQTKFPIVTSSRSAGDGVWIMYNYFEYDYFEDVYLRVNWADSYDNTCQCLQLQYKLDW